MTMKKAYMKFILLKDSDWNSQIIQGRTEFTQNFGLDISNTAAFVVTLLKSHIY